jgi:hypothetical protein
VTESRPPRFIASIAAAALAGALLGCADSPRTSPDPTTVAFALPNGWNVRDVRYLVLSSAGATLASGRADVSDPQATLSLQLSLPLGSGDVLELTVAASSGTSCSGTSQPFDVVAGRPTMVSVVLACGGVASGRIGCPVVDVHAPVPVAAIAPSGTIAVAATAAAVDPSDPLSFSWTATAGTFTAPSAASTSYVCTEVGSETLVLAVTDQSPASGCTLTFLLPVGCLANSDGSLSGP